MKRSPKVVLLLACALLCSACLIDATAVERPHGHFGLMWRIRDAWSGQWLTCEQAGADVVTVSVRNPATGEVLTDSFQCNKYGGWTDAVPPGRYVVDVSLKSCDVECARLSIIADPLGPFEINQGDAFDLGDVELSMARQGGEFPGVAPRATNETRPRPNDA